MKDLYVLNGVTCSDAAFCMAADDDEATKVVVKNATTTPPLTRFQH
jgi:hypothetical protein